MSEVSTRPSGPRGRGSSRGGGRGGFSNRGGRGGTRPANGIKPEAVGNPHMGEDEAEGDIGELKSKYAGKIGTVKEMFPDWSEQDIAFALDETNGDLETTVERISEGTISQWGEVKKKTKDRFQSKTKEPATNSTASTAPVSRSGRGRGGLEGARGGRGSGTDRGRGASRGTRGNAATTNGTRNTKPEAAPPAEPAMGASTSETTVGGWDSATATDTTPLESSWENVTASEAAQPITSQPSKPASKPDGTRSWASMFAKPKPAPAPAKAPQAIPSHDAPPASSINATSINNGQGFAPLLAVQGLPPPVPLNETSEIPNTPPTFDQTSEVPNITPSGDELTETNLELVPDTSGPAASATAASTIASTMDPRNIGTPLQPVQQSQPTGRPPLGGFATSAWKAAGAPSQRTPSFQRKVVEQQEAVVMPGKHAVDRAAVQFGSMGLNGIPDDVDVDSDREDAETRKQPPQHSPVAPRASLPPPPPQQQGFSSQSQAVDSQPTPRQAPGLPPLNQSSTAQQQEQSLSGEHGLPSAPSGYPFNQFSDRFGTQSLPQGSAPKPYEPFGQQAQQAQQSESYPSSSQPSQQQTQSATTSAANDMSFYTSDNPRNPYQHNYYGNIAQQPHQSGQESQQRAGSAFGSSAPQQASQYATTQAPQSQGRFSQAGEAHTSGNSTPNLQLPNQPHQMMGQQQGQGQAGGQYGGYPGYQHPYGGAGYYSSYMNHMNQYGYGGSQGGYGSGPFGGAGGKGAMYGQGHQGYGMSPQTSYDQHSASPANTGAFGSQLPSSARDSTATGGLGSYGGRSGSAQPGENPQQHSGSGGGTYGNAPDPFGGRAASTYQGHNQGLGSGMGPGGNDEPVRGYGDSSKVPGGPSPALGGRPGSAVNTQGQSGQGQGSYGGYPSHMNQGMHGQQSSQYGSGPGGHQSGGQSHQGGGYGAYGAGGYGGNYYGSSSNRGGWSAGANYGH